MMKVLTLILLLLTKQVVADVSSAATFVSSPRFASTSAKASDRLTPPLQVATRFTVEANGEVLSEPIGTFREKSQKEYYQKASHYDQVWGTDNLHFGYYPHLVARNGEKEVPRLNQEQASSRLTQRIIDMANIHKGMRVVDLGAGKGLACLEIATATNASCVGLDITPEYVHRGNEIARDHPDLDLQFMEGSFTNLPQALLDEAPFDVVFAQVALCHVHSQLPSILEQTKQLMGPNSVLIVNEYLGSDNPTVSEATKEHVHKRLHFGMLLGPRQWRETLDQAGFFLLNYENLDAHMRQGYLDMAETARELNLVSADGVPLYINYSQTAKAIDRQEIGMNLAMYRLAGANGQV